jgi:hypothetical protein
MSAGLALGLAAAFNLVCSVDESTFAKSDETSKRDVTVRLRVDLDKRLWCDGECAVVRRIYSVVDQSIIFAFAEDDAVPALLSVAATRDPWIYSSTSRTADHMVVGLGTCDQTPFSGFPANNQPGM